MGGCLIMFNIREKNLEGDGGKKVLFFGLLDGKVGNSWGKPPRKSTLCWGIHGMGSQSPPPHHKLSFHLHSHLLTTVVFHCNSNSNHFSKICATRKLSHSQSFFRNTTVVFHCNSKSTFNHFSKLLALFARTAHTYPKLCVESPIFLSIAFTFFFHYTSYSNCFSKILYKYLNFAEK